MLSTPVKEMVAKDKRKYVFSQNDMRLLLAKNNKQALHVTHAFQNKDQHANMPTCKQVKQDIFKGQSVLHRTRNTINSICAKETTFTKQNRDNKK